MTNVITLDELRKKADEEYAPYQIELGDGLLTIRNPIRIEAERRSRIKELKDELNEFYEKTQAEDDEETAKELSDEEEERLHGLMLEMINLCADNEKLAAVLNEELRGDLGLTQVIFYDWLGEEEVGEASSSAD